MRQLFLPLFVFAVTATSVHAATYPAYVPQGLSTLAQGTLLYNRDSMSGFTTGSVQSVSGQPFTSALRVTVAQPSTNAWDINIRISSTIAVAQDDVMLLVFWARAISGQPETSEGWISALFEKNSADWTKSFSADVAPGREWKQYVFPFTCSQTYAAAGSHWGFNFGAITQVIEIGGLELIHFGSSVSMTQLEAFRTRITYSGIDPDAPWRTQAAARIETFRKADFNLTVLSNGTPSTGATVRIEQTRHAFGFGTAISAGLISSTGETTYMRKIKENFNKSVIENDLKWRYWSSSSERNARTAIDWCNANDINVRGHVLVWPSWRNMPDSASRDSATLERQILNHIDYAVTMFRDKLVEWDVINEPYDNHDAMDLLGRRAMVDWFEKARAADSSARLFINDYCILACNDSAHREHYYNTITFLKDNGAPLQGIGVQGHFGQTPVSPIDILRRLDRFASFGLPISVTEFDVNTKDEELQASYTRDFLTTVFSHPAVNGFLMWGFWEGAHWLPDGAMYRMDWSEKPNLHAYRSLVYDAWWTRDTLSTGTGGTCAVRAFKGDYRISVTIGGVTKEFDVSLNADANLTYDFTSGQVSALRPDGTTRAPTRIGIQLLSGGRGERGVTVLGPSGVRWTLDITDSAGRVLRRQTGAGTQTVEITRGRRAAAGVYVARVSWDGGSISTRIAQSR